MAELLRASVPLLVDLGLQVEWRVLEAPAGFYQIVKRIHDGLQGSPNQLEEEAWSTYEATNAAAARDLRWNEWDPR